MRIVAFSHPTSKFQTIAAAVALATGLSLLGLPSAHAVPDPATHTEHGWCYNLKTYAGTPGRIYYPPNGGCGSSRLSPLVLFMHGNGYKPVEYHNFFKHLARNGYIVVAADVGITVFHNEIPGKAERARDYLRDGVMRKWGKRAFIDTQRTVLMGHSQGGEAVRYLPAILASDHRFDIDAMVGLAATDFFDVPVTGVQTPAALFIVGSMDEDTSAFRTYETADNSGHSGSQLDPVPQPGAIYRSVKLLHDAGHRGFALVGPQMDVTKGYVLAFLNAHVKQDHTFYETYIRGDQVIPGGWTSGVTSQYRDGLLRRVIDNFDDGSLATSDMGTTVQATPGSADVVDLSADDATPHSAQVLEFDPPWSNAIVRWALPAGRRDARAFEFLSLRVGQVDGPPTDDLWIQVRAFGQPMVERRLSDFGTIPQPRSFCEPSGCFIFGTTMAHMGTIRIPVSEFGNVSDVRSVTLVARSEAAQGTFWIDDVEFSEWIWAP